MSVGRALVAELTWGAAMPDVVVGGMGKRDPVGVSAGLPAKAKLLASEVNGGSALYTGAIGADEPCGAMEGELLREEPKEERLESAGFRELPGKELVEVYTWPSADKPEVLCEGPEEWEGPLKLEIVGLVGSVLTSAGIAVAAGADEACCSGLAGLGQWA